MDVGLYPWLGISYTAKLGWAAIGLGLYTGINVETVKGEIEYGYLLLSFPVAAQIELRTAFDSVVNPYVELSAGAALNLIHFGDDYGNSVNDLVVLKPFLAPALGLRFRLGQSFTVSPYCSYTVIFFDGTLYTALAPGLKVTMRL